MYVCTYIPQHVPKCNVVERGESHCWGARLLYISWGVVLIFINIDPLDWRVTCHISCSFRTPRLITISNPLNPLFWLVIFLISTPRCKPQLTNLCWSMYLKHEHLRNPSLLTIKRQNLIRKAQNLQSATLGLEQARLLPGSTKKREKPPHTHTNSHPLKQPPTHARTAILRCRGATTTECSKGCSSILGISAMTCPLDR